MYKCIHHKINFMNILSKKNVPFVFPLIVILLLISKIGINKKLAEKQQSSIICLLKLIFSVVIKMCCWQFSDFSDNMNKIRKRNEDATQVPSHQ